MVILSWNYEKFIERIIHFLFKFWIKLNNWFKLFVIAEFNISYLQEIGAGILEFLLVLLEFFECLCKEVNIMVDVPS